MQKVTEFLEQHVQWIAIGLGALFCLYMTWSYVITPPAEVTIGNDTFGPADIDPHTADTVANQLTSAMQNTRSIQMKVPEYVQAFQNEMTWQNAEPIQLPSMIDGALALDVPLPAVPDQPLPPGVTPPPGTTPPGPMIPDGAVTLASLPVPPTPHYEGADQGLKYGRSVIIPPVLPGQPPPPPPAIPGDIPPGAIDKDWVTQMWKVSMNDIETAFRKAGMDNPAIPPQFKTTLFLHVEMVREEMVDGQWQNETVIRPLDVTRNNQPRPPFPGDIAADPQVKGQQFGYMMWAAQNTPDIIQPLFHQTVEGRGDRWEKPGQQVMLAAEFNPAMHQGGKGNLNDEQWKQVLEYRREQYRLEQEQKKQNRGTPAPRGQPRGPGGFGVPADMEGMYAPRRDIRDGGGDDALPFYAPPPVPLRPVPGRGGYGGGYGVPPDLYEDGAMGGYGEGYGGYAGPQQVALPQPGQDYPTGEFDPTTAQPQPWKGKDVEIWAHDDTVQPGKTYRYKMRYRLKNPIFGASPNIAADPKMVEQFALVSEFSEWTTQITTPSLVNFFVAGGVVRGRGTVDTEIFSWHQGQQRLERFTLAPGDLVGWAKNGVDYSTDWTVVDFRDDPRTNDPQVLLVNNETGKVTARSYQTDSRDRLYQALKEQVKKAAEAAAAAAGTAPPGVGTAAAR